MNGRGGHYEIGDREKAAEQTYRDLQRAGVAARQMQAEVRAHAIVETWQRNRNQAATARELGVSRMTVHRALKAAGLLESTEQ